MKETSVTLQEFSVSNGDGSHSTESPLIVAARNGDAQEIRKILQEKDPHAQDEEEPLYPDDWKYHFKDLLQVDSEGRTALHIAASIGDPRMSLDCVSAILQSLQMIVKEDGWPTSLKKHQKLVNMTDKYGDTALHFAIENRAAEVAAYLLNRQANFMARNHDDVEALQLIYENLPEAMRQIYSESINLTKDFKGLKIKWGPIIGFCKSDEESSSGHSDKLLVPGYRCHVESKNLKHVLSSDRWGAPILDHPLVQLYLEQKWKKIQWFFWITFFLEMLWLLLYAAAFVSLHLQLKRNGTDNCAVMKDPSHDCTTKGYLVLWALMATLTIICALKEVYQGCVLLKAYWNFENITQDVFICLVFIQFALLVSGYPEFVVTSGVVGIIFGTMLMIFQVGRTPYFGLQVAAWKKVMFSFAPHLPVFFIWFAGFGLIFWAILYKAEESWLVSMVAIMAAMGTGELNAEEHLTPDKEDGDTSTTTFKECVRAFAMLFFVILIVTLYFNLLIGYAVSDIQILKDKAKTLQLSNKLSTIYTIESFLTTGLGEAIVRFKCKFDHILCRSSQRKINKNALDSIFVMPPSDYVQNNGEDEIKLNEVPRKLLNPLSQIAYENVDKNKEKKRKLEERIAELMQ